MNFVAIICTQPKEQWKKQAGNFVCNVVFLIMYTLDIECDIEYIPWEYALRFVLCFVIILWILVGLAVLSWPYSPWRFPGNHKGAQISMRLPRRNGPRGDVHVKRFVVLFVVDTLKPRRNDHSFADDSFKRNFCMKSFKFWFQFHWSLLLEA